MYNNDQDFHHGRAARSFVAIALCAATGACSGDSGGDSASSTSAATEATTSAAATEATTDGSTDGSATAGTTSQGGTTTSASESDSAATAASTTAATTSGSDSATDSDAATDTATDSDSDSDSTTGVDPGALSCSADLREVIDEQGVTVETCAADQGCAAGACVPACASAAASEANFGCEFMVPTPPAYPPAKPPCFAAFLANTWGHPAKVSLARGGAALDISVAARLVTPGLAPKDWPPLPESGIPTDSVAVIFLSSDPTSVMPETQVKLSCPVTPAVNASTVIPASGRSDAFVISADIPVTAYDIMPFGGAPSHFPSAALLFPTAVWGNNYVAIAPPVGTHNPPGPLWMQIVGLEDGTKVELRPSAELSQGPSLNGALADQLAVFEVNAGEVLQWQLPQAQKKDPSGTIVLSDKPVGLYTGNRFLRLQPTPAPGGESAHQQNSAVTALGSTYVAAPYETRRKDLAPELIDYRMVGVVDGTTLTYNPPVPGAPLTLAQGQIADFKTELAFKVSGQDAKHPFALAQMMVTANLPGGTRPGATAMGYPPMLGDEEFVVVLPPAQYLDRYAFFTDPTYPTTNIVVTRARKANKFEPVTVGCLGELDGWEPVGDEGFYEFTTVDLVRAGVGVKGCENGLHLAESAGPFGLVVWGLDSYSSYAYPAGGNASALSDVVIIPQ